MNESMRLNWVDSLKGFAILLVVLGHIQTNHLLFFNFDSQTKDIYIYSFHMPLFFFISGFLFNSEKWISKATEFVSTRVKNIVLPYINYMVISAIFWIICAWKFNLKIQFLGLQPIEMIYRLLYANTNMFSDINYALWFLPALFIVEILYFFIIKLMRYKLLICSVIIIFVGIASFYRYPFTLPWHVNSALFALPFFAGGHYFRYFYQKVVSNVPLVILITSIHFILASSYWFDMQLCNIGNIPLFYITGFSGTITYMFVFNILGKHNIKSQTLNWIGQNSLIVMCTHVLLISFIKLWLSVSSDVLFFMVMFFEIPIIHIITRYFNWINGKPTSFKLHIPSI
jgi:acyltransferase